MPQRGAVGEELERSQRGMPIDGIIKRHSVSYRKVYMRETVRFKSGVRSIAAQQRDQRKLLLHLFKTFFIMHVLQLPDVCEEMY